MLHETPGRAGGNASAAANADFGIDDVSVFSRGNGLYRALRGTNATLGADVDLVGTRIRKVTDNLQGAFLRVILIKVS